MTAATDLTRARLAAGLEDAARLLRDHPDLPLPMVTGSEHTEAAITIAWYLDIEYDDPTDQTAAWLRIATAIAPGQWETYPPATRDERDRGWTTRLGRHLRLIVTYRLAEATSS